MNNSVVTRFAPSPTGFMHIGNLRTALYAYLLAKANNGKFIVRIEDTDQVRLVDGAVEVIMDTLRTTGLSFDEGPGIDGPNGPYVQSQRKDIYKKYALELVEKGKAYYCFCTQERLQKLHEADDIGGYDRHCRNLTPEEVAAHLANGDPYVIRQCIPLTGTTSYYDEVFGEITMDNKEMQDQILLKADGYPTYNFAHVVDDHLMGVTHVVRGSEYLTSTPKYVLLYDDFGWERPHYVHLPLIMGKNDDGTISKLSKRHGAVSFHDLAKAGYLPEAVINYIALLGWCPKDSNQEIFTLEELQQAFSIDGISKSPSVFDYGKLNWFNSEYIKKLTPEEFAVKAIPLMQQDLNADVDLVKLANLLHTRVTTINEVTEMIQFVKNRLPLDIELYTNKKNKTTPELCLQILQAVKPLLEACGNWHNDELFELLKAYASESGIKAGAVMWAVRIAVARQAVTPGGATELMEVFGKKESLERIQLAINELLEN